MCQMIYLLSDRRLNLPTDETAYPCLKLHPVEDGQEGVLAGIERVTSAAFVYDVSPDGYCGCYFYHETPELFAEHRTERETAVNVDYATTPEQDEAMWRGRTSALKSFARYLSDHAEARLSVYVVWEGCAGQNEPARVSVPPSYFDAPGFTSLPEDLLLTIVPESAFDEERPWDTAAPRTHEWMSFCQGAADSDAT